MGKSMVAEGKQCESEDMMRATTIKKHVNNVVSRTRSACSSNNRITINVLSALEADIIELPLLAEYNIAPASMVLLFKAIREEKI
jgi:hypothetical protein